MNTTLSVSDSAANIYMAGLPRWTGVQRDTADVVATEYLHLVREEQAIGHAEMLAYRDWDYPDRERDEELDAIAAEEADEAAMAALCDDDCTYCSGPGPDPENMAQFWAANEAALR